jgi:hypothetical protein
LDESAAAIKNDHGGSKMIIKCSFSIPLKAIGDYNRQAKKLPPLPIYITKRGPYIDETKGTANRITTVYEFDKSRLSEAWKNISIHLDVFRAVQGFSLSAQVINNVRPMHGQL